MLPTFAFFAGRGYRSGFGVDMWEGRLRGLDRSQMDIALHYLEGLPRDEHDEFWEMWQGMGQEERWCAI